MDYHIVDSKLIHLLNEMNSFSVMKTCLLIRLADYAAQLCGCRSTRQVDDEYKNKVEDEFEALVELLYSHIEYSFEAINSKHEFLTEILSMNDNELEVLLEDTLYEMTVYDCKNIFNERFLV